MGFFQVGCESTRTPHRDFEAGPNHGWNLNLSAGWLCHPWGKKLSQGILLKWLPDVKITEHEVPREANQPAAG
jgi:hypothetical protein